MAFTSKYKAKKPDANGIINFTAEENNVWQELITRQIPIVENRACDEYLTGLELLDLPKDHVPQCHEINGPLEKATGWTVYPVEALIPDDYFFELLANRKFPAATFIRRPDEIDYLQEPDIFHEYFGHCPILTDPTYAKFIQHYGEVALKASPDIRKLLGRLYWFTVEFGLIKTNRGTLCYGGGILSSKEETVYAVESNIPERRPFNDGTDAIRTPYRIDILQPIYYVINNFQDLYNMLEDDIVQHIKDAIALGEFSPTFEKESQQPFC